MDFFLLPQVAPFTAALAAVAVIGMFELLSLVVLGVAAITHVLDNLLDLDTPDFAGLDWVLIKGVPLMVTLITALGGFGCAGLAVQTMLGTPGEPVALLPAASIGIVGALASVRGIGAFFKRYQIAHHSTAVSLESLVGREAVLQSQLARIGFLGEALVRDEHGNVHYVFVQPEEGTPDLVHGARLELLAFDGSNFRARAVK
ncbi:MULTISPECIES: OB-fold-containig protein [unclassified Variovorax]|uniref:OB-fold-containig protein n=1 Tax=unclassified Variovorax TaxID=663243 RepID=UPI001318B08C|nr:MULTISPECIES: OB-fold-containig protein [unclassified Variovorax]VTU42900.1 Inner membrane protein YqiJ [Variovorax sp. PBL-H6]VTU43596.1 Inner membrane protein YqiJ [Variovorax sp. SRS16]VTU43658.1 Inner membrane protein YqiJ [Variovorax sp. PBL-E5]